MAVQKKRISISKKHIRKNLWKRKGYWPVLKAFYLAKSLSTANSKSFFVQEKKIKDLTVRTKTIININNFFLNKFCLFSIYTNKKRADRRFDFESKKSSHSKYLIKSTRRFFVVFNPIN